MNSDAAAEYAVRRAFWQAEHDRRVSQDRRMAYGRLTVFAAGVLLGFLAYWGDVSAWWLVVPAVLFVLLLRQHDDVIRRRGRAARLVAWYERALARLAGRWAGAGEAGERFADEAHPYAGDLDLFGRGSLFELLSLARTYAGEDTLAGWLKRPAPMRVLRDRHDAVRELRTGLDLRESLAVAGDDVRSGLHAEPLMAWAVTPALHHASRLRTLAMLLTAAMTAFLAAAVAVEWLWLAMIAVALRVIYQHVDGERVEMVLRRAERAARELDVLRVALQILERDTFQSAHLLHLQATLRESAGVASVAIGRLHRYVEMHEWTHNMVFGPVAALLMWDTHLAVAIDRWRHRHGDHVAVWLQAVGEFEALGSLAAYAFEHPDDPFPDLLDQPPAAARGAAVLSAAGLGHPLLPVATSVRNDVSLGETTQLLVISGSNMSGKSTLLRTVGINAVLALAGAPVRAASLRLSPLAIGATLRIQDSLQEGRSRFFAEITRIRHIADIAAEQPLLFLLDELFHGTNSHDRLAGATGVLRSLVDRGAIGLITTHDLALTGVAAAFEDRAANVHFEDSFDGVDMRFDYRVKPGPVTRSNAIALMRAVGLDVREEQP